MRLCSRRLVQPLEQEIDADASSAEAGELKDNRALCATVEACELYNNSIRDLVKLSSGKNL